MAAYPPNLPLRFPCWVRAVYSWGGENKNDLGFIEGDLIECLNAGDGSWWMGRLRRDKRMMGLFPSNFVELLEEGFHPPQSRSPSPMPALNGGSVDRRTNAAPVTTPQKSKSSYMKPFQSMRAPSPAPPSAKASTTSRPVSQNNNQPSLPWPDSTELWNMGSHSRPHSRAPSPSPTKDFGSSPPPPAPPPHRIAVTSQVPRRTPSPSPSMNDRFPAFARTPSPIPPSPTVNGHTPSPLRDAMDDVMDSLRGMELPHDPQSRDGNRSPFNPWSPEAFDQLHQRPASRVNLRPYTSLGLNGNQSYEPENEYSNAHNSPERYDDGPPQLSNYVERMESRLRQLHAQRGDEYPDDPPAPPPKNSPFRPSSAAGGNLRHRKSAYELGKDPLARTYTTKTNSSNGTQSTTTNSTTSTNATSQSIMSGKSAGGFSATSAGSYARRNKFGSLRGRPMTALGNTRPDTFHEVNSNATSGRPQTLLTGLSYHSSHDSREGATSAAGRTSSNGYADPHGMFGGLASPQTKKRGFFKKIMDSAKTGAASARSSIAASQTGSNPSSPTKSRLTNPVTGISSVPQQFGRDAAQEMGLGGATLDWVHVRRDVNRSNSLSRIEKQERADRCAMMDHPAIDPVDELFAIAEGDEGADGHPILEPTNWNLSNLSLVDKSARFINSLPPMTNSTSLAQGYVCRPYKSDVQKLRAIFTWVGEKIGWDEDFEGEIDTRRVIQTKRGCSEEVANLVMEMCSSVGLHAEVVRGYLKTPGEVIDLDVLSRPNHWWNAVLVDNEWRIMDCSLASPTNPRRALFSSSQMAESWYFLPRPMEICYTHVPLLPEQQHICPPVAHDVLLALPCACPAYFKNSLQMLAYNTSMVRIEALELVQIQISVPPDIECVAEVEAKSFFRDDDGDYFESGEVVRKRALAQADWIQGQKRFTIKALLPGDEGEGMLKIYAGKRGLMHSSKENPHAMAFALPILHTGENPPYDFLLRHPTPHAQRNDLYVIQPQCARLAINNTFVFAIRQHASSLSASTPPLPNGVPGRISPSPFIRPTSAMSMTSSAASGSNPSNPMPSDQKPAKLAIQSPTGKILRLTRKAEHTSSKNTAGAWEDGDGSVWETVIKVSERGTWRALVLADRSARWCVWGEWECV